jgi:serine/threonine protein kinase
MAQPTNPHKGFPAPGNASGNVEQQKTLLLSDVPETPSVVPEAIQPSTLTTAHLSSAALTALAQRYEIAGEAGHGSMGNVYKARDRETGEIVALKLLKPEIASDQAMMERFKNELLFARKITHKNVCRVYEFNRIGGIAYTSMEFVEGESLRSVLNRFGGLPRRKAADLVIQMCSGLKEAHAQGIVHRDLKPENVMIDTQGNVKIMDFGIARSMEAVTRLTGSMVGTPAYMAPEQVAGKPVDYRTDIYSLGLIMYEVFTGAQAFQAENAVAVALKQMREAPAPPHEVDPTIPNGIERVILKCLEKEPPKRFQSIAELESAVRAPAASAVTTTNLADIPFNRSAHDTLVPRRPFAPQEKKRTPAFVWVLFGALLVLAVLGGARAKKIVQSNQALNPPAPLPAPAPPAFALDIPAAPPAVATPATADAESAEPLQADADAPATAGAAADSAASPPVREAPAPTPPRRSHPAAHNEAAPDMQQRTDHAFGQASPLAGKPGDSRSGYIWVGRYERDDRAQAAVKKIEDLGLPVQVLPRQNGEVRAFAVFAGPFADDKISGALELLQLQGFAAAHAVGISSATPSRNRAWSSNRNPNPNP